MADRVRSLGVVLRRVLDVLWYLLLALGAAAILAFAGFLAAGGHVRADVPVAFRLQPGASLTGPGRLVSLTGLSGTLHTRASPLAAAGILLFAVLGWGLALFGLWQLRVVLRDALGGVPFGPESARRIELIGVAIIALDLVRGCALLAGALWARDHIHLARVSFPVTFPVQVTTLVAGLLVIALAEVFRIGHSLQQDRDLTI